MKCEQALESVALNGSDHSQDAIAAKKFLYGSGEPGRDPVTVEARAVLSSPELAGDDFSIIRHEGRSSLVIGNGSRMLKISRNKFRFDEMKDSVAIKDIPKNLAAKVFGDGKCNSVPYLICERLRIDRLPSTEEVVAYLFKAHDAHVTYYDPKPSNFGYDDAGVLKVLDNEHFSKISQDNFTAALRDGLARNKARTPYPLIFSDAEQSYVVFDPYLMGRPDYTPYQKALRAVLKAGGVSDDAIEIKRDTPVVRIDAAEIISGIPAHKEALTEYLQKHLPSAIRLLDPEVKAESMLSVVHALLRAFPKGSGIRLPDIDRLGAMDRETFARFSEDLLRQVRETGKASEPIAEGISATLNHYAQKRYPQADVSQETSGGVKPRHR